MPITIAIPFYNAERFLRDAIRSVFAQTYQDWELILIDDGSTDSSLSIAQSVKDRRVKVISDGKNKKLSARLNEITQIAKYEYIARMDADDLMFPNKLELQMKYLHLNPAIDLISTGVYSVLNDLTISGIRGNDYEYPLFKDLLTRKIGFTHASLIAKKTWYLRNKYDESLSIGQDLDLWLRSSKNNDFKAKSISAPLYIYREEENITKNKLLRAYSNERKMIRKYSEEEIVFLLLKSHFKSFAVKIIAFTGNISMLQKMRGKEIISNIHIKVFNEAINKIKETKIPGIDAE